MAQNTGPTFEQLSAVRKDKQDLLLSKANVVGVGVGHKIKGGQSTGELSLVVYVTRKMDPGDLRAEALVPEEVDGVQTDVFETGEIFAGMEPLDRVEPQILARRVRPVAGGFSVGHTDATSGTLGTAAYEVESFPGIPRRYVILSNNHVLANANAGRVGDPVLQPGRYDGGTDDDVIGRLLRFVPIRFDGEPNQVDAAIAEVDFQNLDREIFWIGHVRGVKSATVGMLVQKTGRTTHYTTGEVTGLDATVQVNYGAGRTATLEKQIILSRMSEPGDSGSLICDMEGYAVGLLFAGSPEVTIANDIQEVQRQLKIRVA